MEEIIVTLMFHQHSKLEEVRWRLPEGPDAKLYTVWPRLRRTQRWS